MTEAEWLTCRNPVELDCFLDSGERSARKFRLLSSACCRHMWHLLTFPGSRELVELVERYADGLVEQETMEKAAEQLTESLGLRNRPDLRPDMVAARVVEWAAWSDARGNHGNSEGAGYVLRDLPQAQAEAEAWIEGLDRAAYLQICDRVEGAACSIVREVFGNPFRPVAVDPAWRTSDVMALGKGIYDERAFDRMPILADALQDAGCDNDDILNHLRDANATHVRGCWALDLVLGKE